MTMSKDINDREHGKFREINGGTSVSIYNEPTTPLEGNNPSTALSYDVDGNLITITETIAGIQYQTTLTYTAGVLDGVSEAVAL